MVTPGVRPAQVEGQADHVDPDEGYAESGSSELSVGGGIYASCDEEYSELVVGGVAVASGGVSA